MSELYSKTASLTPIDIIIHTHIEKERDMTCVDSDITSEIHYDNIVATFAIGGTHLTDCRHMECECRRRPCKKQRMSEDSVEYSSQSICLDCLVHGGHGLLCYDPKRFATVTYHALHPRFTALIFGTAQAVVTGTRSVEAARAAAHSMIRLCNECGLRNAYLSNFKIQNIVVNCLMKQKINLTAMQENIPNVTYNPDMFPGLRLRMNNSVIGANVFRNGTVIITGCKSVESVNATWREIHKQIMPFIQVTHNDNNAMYIACLEATRQQTQVQVTKMLELPADHLQQYSVTAEPTKQSVDNNETEIEAENMMLSLCDAGLVVAEEIEIDHYNIIQHSSAASFLNLKCKEQEQDTDKYKVKFIV
jgi:TATA-box binding protein (TBP) (component of TFIID and TFIIIB)